MQDRTAIVTGAASGLGRALALRLASAGWQVALADVDQLRLGETLALITAAGGKAQAERLDVTRPDEWAALHDRLRAVWPRLDLLVNNAGVSCSGEVGTFSLENWRWAAEVNLFGPIYGCHTMVPWLKENPRRPHIVNVASLAAFASAPAMAAYNVTKAGVVALSETLYAELRHRNVGVTVACPGFFATNLLACGRFQTDQELAQAAAYTERSRNTADDVARRILRGVERRELYVLTPAKVGVLWWLKRLAPRTVLKIIASRYHNAFLPRSTESASRTAAPAGPAEGCGRSC